MMTNYVFCENGNFFFFLPSNDFAKVKKSSGDHHQMYSSTSETEKQSPAPLPPPPVCLELWAISHIHKENISNEMTNIDSFIIITFLEAQ